MSQRGSQLESQPSSSRRSSGRTQTQTQEDVNFALLCKIDNAKTISDVLSCLNFRKTATCTVSEAGLKVTVQESACMQATAFLKEGLFQEYRYPDCPHTFDVHLDVLLHCMNVFGLGNAWTALQMCYAGEGHPFVLLLEENGVITDCGVTTLQPTELVDFEWNESPVKNKIIVQSEALRDAFAELDPTSSEVSILLSPAEPYFRLTCEAPSGSCEITFPKDSDVLSSFRCTETRERRFKMSLLQPIVKALWASSETALKMNSRGMMCFQLMIRAETGQTSFVEFVVCPEEDFDASDNESE